MLDKEDFFLRDSVDRLFCIMIFINYFREEIMKHLKKFMLLLTTAVLFVLAAVGMVACGGEDDGGDENADLSQYAGVYKLTQIKWDMGAMIRTYNLGDEVDGASLTEDYLTFDFKADGTVTVTSSIPQSQEGFTGTKTGSWTVVGTAIQTSVMSDNLSDTIHGCGFRTASDGALEFYYTTSRMQTYTYFLTKK